MHSNQILVLTLYTKLLFPIHSTKNALVQVTNKRIMLNPISSSVISLLICLISSILCPSTTLKNRQTKKLLGFLITSLEVSSVSFANSSSSSKSLNVRRLQGLVLYLYLLFWWSCSLVVLNIIYMSISSSVFSELHFYQPTLYLHLDVNKASQTSHLNNYSGPQF